MPTFAGRGGCQYPLDERVKVDFLADRVASQSASPVNKVRRLVALRRALRELAPDVILSFLPHVNVAAVISALGLGIPVVVSERIYPPAMPLGPVLERLRRWTYPRAHGVVVQTEQAREWLNRTCPQARGHVIANPVVYPLPTGEPVVPPDRVTSWARRMVLAVGRLSDQKQFDVLMAAFAELAPGYPQWDLVILGEGEERDRLERERERLGLGGRARMPGRVGNLSDWYNRADLFVMSSRFEGFPNTLIEAMAHGLPAVSFDCRAGPRDIIRDGTDGLLVSPEGGAPGLARAMETLMRDEPRRQEMAGAAVAVRERFSMERIAAQWDTVLGLTREQHV